jgi:putative pyrroloquinoline-quinone binding quinoprotein/putative pyrroloquinoline-quinone-binding quinoprotein
MKPTRASRSDRTRRSFAALAACVALAAIAGTAALWAGGRRQRTVFLSQPDDWAPLMDEDHKLPTLVFKTAWTWSGFKAPLAGDPVLCAGSIVATSRDGEVAALDPITGEVRWRVSLEEPPSSGAASDGTLLFVAGVRDRLRALQGRDGAPVWTAELPAAPVIAPRVIGTRVLIGTADGTLLSIETESGRIAATCLLPGRPSTPAEPAPGSVLVGTDHGAVLALEESRLEVRFRHDTGAAITSPPVFEDGRVWFAAADRTVRCLRFKSGRERWVARTGAMCTARPVVHGPYLYVLSYDDDIYVFNRRNGHQLTRVRLDHRLETDATVARDHLLVVPFTEASLVGLALPALQKVGRFDLQAPGEWFTTAPLWVSDRVALGYGRSAGTILALLVSEQAAPAAGAGEKAGPKGPPPAGSTDPEPGPTPSPR